MGNPDEEDTQDTAEFIPLDPGESRFYETEPRVLARVDVAGRSHPGKVRQNNEDNYLVVRRYRGRQVLLSSLPTEFFNESDDHAYAFAVADGMGGRNFGEIASLLAMRIGWELGGSEIKWSMKMNERESEELRRKAETSFRLINQALRDEVRESPQFAGMGTTLTVCYSTGPELFVMHAGDSRAYLYRGGALRRLTRDHNLAQEWIDSGLAKPGSQEAAGVQHILTNVLGGPDDTISVDIHQHRLAEGDLVLLCTDGMTDTVTEDEIARVLREQPDPNHACPALVDLALDRGGRDNVTVVLARYHFEEIPSWTDKLRKTMGDAD